MLFKGIKNLIVAFLFVFLLCHQTCLTVICEENSAQVYPHLIFQNGYYGYVNDSGKIIIPCQWEDAGEFRGRGYASVMIDRQTQEYGIIDINGNYVMRFIGGIEESQNGVYCGGMHTGIYWLQNEEGVGFFDVTTGYFSGFIFHRNQDIWYCLKSLILCGCPLMEHTMGMSIQQMENFKFLMCLPANVLAVLLVDILLISGMTHILFLMKKEILFRFQMNLFL